jgi:hypothetical protein
MDETVKGRWRGNANASLAYLEFIGRDNTIISLKRNRRLTITLGCQTGNLDLFRGVMVSLICQFRLFEDNLLTCSVLTNFYLVMKFCSDYFK